jgi:hypothetical protein
VGAVSVPRQELPVTAKSAGLVPVSVDAPKNVTVPVPPMFTVIVCGALTAGLVFVGTPKDKSVGESVKVGDCASVTFPLTSRVQSRSIHSMTTRELNPKNLISPSFGQATKFAFEQIIHLRRENDAGLGDEHGPFEANKRWQFCL